MRVTVAETGATGLDRAARAPFDALVLDLMLPDMDGLNVCRKLRADSALPSLIVFALPAGLLWHTLGESGGA